MVHAVNKGKRGENLFCKWLLDNCGIDQKRNHWQAEGKCADIIIDDFIFEIKFREVHNLEDYWYQVVMAKQKQNHKNKNLIPIVAFKSARVKWQFLIPANLINGVSLGYVIATEKVFKQLIDYVLER